MPKRYYCTSIIQFIIFKKHMLQAAITDLFSPLVTKAHNSVSKSKIPLTYLASKSQLILACGFYFCTRGTSVLRKLSMSAGCFNYAKCRLRLTFSKLCSKRLFRASLWDSAWLLSTTRPSVPVSRLHRHLS